MSGGTEWPSGLGVRFSTSRDDIAVVDVAGLRAYMADCDAPTARLREAEGLLRRTGGVLLVALDPLPPGKECGALCEACESRFREQSEAIAAFLRGGEGQT